MLEVIDDIGSYFSIDVKDRIPLHANKAEEFYNSGDKFNAVAHAKECIKLGSTGNPYCRANLVLCLVQAQHACLDDFKPITPKMAIRKLTHQIKQHFQWAAQDESHFDTLSENRNHEAIKKLKKLIETIKTLVNQCPKNS